MSTACFALKVSVYLFLRHIDGVDFSGLSAWLAYYLLRYSYYFISHRKMADVLDIENQDEFEFDEDGDRKLIVFTFVYMIDTFLC